MIENPSEYDMGYADAIKRAHRIILSLVLTHQKGGMLGDAKIEALNELCGCGAGTSADRTG